MLYHILIAAGLVIFLLNLILNLRSLKKPRRDSKVPEPAPLISILIPARDEEANIETCLKSLQKQDYPNYEILVLDDNSADSTPDIVAGMATADRRIRLIPGEPLPEDWAGKRGAGVDSFPTFTQLTFRRGLVSGARFGPDGHSVVYSASWDSAPLRVYTTDPGSPRATTAALHEAHLLAVSEANELAVLLKPTLGLLYSNGTLARAPLGAGAPREVLAGVQQGDWSRDGELAVVRMSAGHSRLEFPIGKMRYETSGWLSSPRVSPQGDVIAFIEQAGGLTAH